jgi:hypothetical protein
LNLQSTQLSTLPITLTHASRAVTFNMPSVDDGFEALLEPFYNGKKLTDPISTKEDKFQLLPAFLKVKGTCALPSLPTVLLLTEDITGLVKQYVPPSRAPTPHLRSAR